MGQKEPVTSPSKEGNRAQNGETTNGRGVAGGSSNRRGSSAVFYSINACRQTRRVGQDPSKSTAICGPIREMINPNPKPLPHKVWSEKILTTKAECVILFDRYNVA